MQDRIVLKLKARETEPSEVPYKFFFTEKISAHASLSSPQPPSKNPRDLSVVLTLLKYINLAL